MRKLFILFAMISLFGLYSCEKDKSDSPGQIQGMGNTSGDLQVKESYTLPDGIHLVGDITGIKNPDALAGEIKISFSDAKTIYPCYGSGKYVRLQLTLLNTGNYPRTVFFPKGLLWQCKYGDTQHGLQVQTTWTCLQPNSSRTIFVELYCLNAGIPSPDQTALYKILGVTSSKVMWNFLNHIGWRKVNYEMIYGSFNSRKGTEAGPTYEEITERLQIIIHNLTNYGIDITAEDKAFIESIPELEPDQIPVVDENSQFPEYFKEFIFPGK